MALPTRLVSTCRSRPGSPRSAVGTSMLRRSVASFEPLRERALGEQVDGAFDGAAQVEVERLERAACPASIFEKSRMSLMIVSSASALAWIVSANSRCCGDRVGVEQQAGHADDAVHRRADLVAHVGQELRLEPRRFERRVARRAQLPLDPLALGDVAEHRADRLAPRIHRRVEAAGHLDAACRRRAMQVRSTTSGARSLAAAPSMVSASGASPEQQSLVDVSAAICVVRDAEQRAGTRDCAREWRASPRRTRRCLRPSARRRRGSAPRCLRTPAVRSAMRHSSCVPRRQAHEHDVLEDDPAGVLEQAPWLAVSTP